MVRVDADVVPLQVESVLTGVHSFELVVVLEVGPTPQATVNNMR